MARSFFGAFVAAGILLSLPTASRAQDDWATSLYSTGGAELRVDERIFTLFALLNEMGYDNAPITRNDPVPRREFDPVRQAVRDAVGMDPALRAKFDAFFDKHPLPVRAYLTYTLAIGAAPEFKAPAKAPPGTESLKGFEALLQEFHAKAKIGSMFTKAVEIHRNTMRTWSPVVDKPVAEARAALNVPETDDSPQIVVVVNLLDGRGTSSGILIGDELFLVVGPPGEKPDATTVARAFARAEVAALAKGKGKNLKNGSALLQEIRNSGLPVESDDLDDYVADNLARVIAIKATTPAGQAGQKLDEEYSRGFLLVKELNRGLAIFAASKGSKPLDQFIADFLREIDTARLLAGLKGS